MYLSIFLMLLIFLTAKFLFKICCLAVEFKKSQQKQAKYPEVYESFFLQTYLIEAKDIEKTGKSFFFRWLTHYFILALLLYVYFKEFWEAHGKSFYKLETLSQ